MEIKFSRVAVAWATLSFLSFSASVNASFVYSGGTSQALSTVVGNDYKANMMALGFDQMTTGAQLSVDQDGFIDFYFIAAESGYSNTFTVTDHVAGGTSSINEPPSNVTPFGFNGLPGYPTITIAVKAGEIVDLSFDNGQTGVTKNTVINLTATKLFDLGLVANSAAGGPLNQIILAYDDQLSLPGFDDNHDDMMIRADFRPVPVPAAIWLLCSGLAGLFGVAFRKHR